MFSIFGKKGASYPTESKWSILKGENQGKAMFIRRNDSAKQLLGHPEYIYRAGFAVPFLNPNADGLPTNEEAEILNSIEDELSLKMESNRDGLLTLVITTNGFREFVFYTKRPDMVKDIVSLVQSKFNLHKIQFYIEEDNKWAVYKQFS